MASAARCMRSLLRNSSTLNVSSKSILRCLNGSTSGSTKTLASLRSCLKEAGLVNSTRNNSLSCKVTFSQNFRSASMLCNLSAIPLMAIDGVAGASDVLDGSLGDEEGETWCQNSEEGYIGDDT